MTRLMIAMMMLTLTTAAFADEPLLADEPLGDGTTSWEQRQAFDRNFAIGVHGIGWGGSYQGGGIGGNIRYEYRETIGIDLFSDHLLVSAEGGTRHDHPVGFSLYIPYRLSDTWRIRPLFGFCAVFSFFQPDQEGVKRIDDIQFGVHAGGGIERQIGRWVSFFFDLQGVAYLGHDRYQGGWETHVGDELTVWGVVEAKLGIQVHL